MPLIATLDKENRLIGFEEITKEEVTEKHVVVPDNCDLSTDATYKWDGTAFLPLGFGYAKPRRPPIDTEYALYLLIKTVYSEVPQECREWHDWYQEEMARRIEELQMRRRLGKSHVTA